MKQSFSSEVYAQEENEERKKNIILQKSCSERAKK